MDKEALKVYGIAILFSTLVGFSFIGVKTAIQVSTTLQLLTFRYNFAFLGALVILAFGWSKVTIRGKAKKNILITSGFYIAFMIFQTVGLIFVSTIESGIIFAIVPILVKIIAAGVLKEKSTALQNFFVCLCVGALILMIVMGAGEINANVVGILLLLISSLSMAISNVYMRYVRSQYTPIEISFMITLGGCLVFNLATIVSGIKNENLSEYFAPLSHGSFVLATAYLGIACTTVTALFMSYMLANMPAVKATIFGNLSTAISIVAGVVVLNESLKVYHVICTILIIIGVIGVSLTGEKEEENG
ncbi:DMT family transporter [Clostridium aminobutyricum]|uniref:DMT family transporter n=1 Tax=Clostridium aminobutyricum TaxID=33953 RepID=A0A939IIA6_CLOAM|nr:DMT family transporter [Clostridium aminobutyricum]MBN7772871.1 DMT family transporter [Clostridium aminobutyricum]